MYLVTGGAGFIGSHTVDLLLSQGHRVRVLDNLSTGFRTNVDESRVELVVGDICDPDAVAKAMVGVERVIHLAARISVPDSIEDPLGYDATNVHGTLKVMQAARAAGVKRMAFASSCAVYGCLPGLPKSEADQLSPESPYAATKLCNENYARSYSVSMGLECVGLRYFNVYGPRQDANGPYGAVIPTFVQRALRGQTLTIYGDGEQGRDFVNVRDVARANVAATVAPGAAGEVFNVGGGRMMSINDLANAVRDVVGEIQVEHAAPRIGEVRFSQADISKAQRLLDWSPQAEFDSALRETVSYFRDILS